MDLCVARIGERHIALDGAVVRRVAQVGPVTWLPRSPEHFAGLVADRGLVLALIDPLELLGTASGAAQGDQMIVLGTPLGDLALRVDAVLTFGAVAVDDASDADPSPFVARTFSYHGARCDLLDTAAVAAQAARSTRGTSPASSSVAPTPPAPPR